MPSEWLKSTPVCSSLRVSAANLDACRTAEHRAASGESPPHVWDPPDLIFPPSVALSLQPLRLSPLALRSAKESDGAAGAGTAGDPSPPRTDWPASHSKFLTMAGYRAAPLPPPPGGVEWLLCSRRGWRGARGLRYADAAPPHAAAARSPSSRPPPPSLRRPSLSPPQQAASSLGTRSPSSNSPSPSFHLFSPPPPSLSQLDRTRYPDHHLDDGICSVIAEER